MQEKLVLMPLLTFALQLNTSLLPNFLERLIAHGLKAWLQRDG